MRGQGKGEIGRKREGEKEEKEHCLVLSPMHIADADATQLDSCVASESAVCRPIEH